MRKYFFSLLILFMITSCEESTRWDAKRRIVNSTNHYVDVRVYGNIMTKDSVTFSLLPNDSIDFDGECYTGFDEYCDIGWMETEYAEILFDSMRIQKFQGYPSSCNGGKGINVDPRASNCYGYTLRNENGILIQTYTITEEDFEQAEEIEF